MGDHVDELGALAVAASLFIGVLGITLAGFLADVVSHLAVFKNLPSRHELAHLSWVALKALGSVFVPLVLLGLAALDVSRPEAGVVGLELLAHA